MLSHQEFLVVTIALKLIVKLIRLKPKIEFGFSLYPSEHNI